MYTNMIKYYELIIPFQFHMKSSIHVIISKKHTDEVFHLNKYKCMKKKSKITLI
jgi:hypothetical protein